MYRNIYKYIYIYNCRFISLVILMTSYNSKIDYQSKYKKYKTKYINGKRKHIISGGSQSSDKKIFMNVLADHRDPLKGNGASYGPSYDIGSDVDDKRLNVFQDKNEHHVTLKEPWFTYIKEQRKTIEGRINKGLFKRLQSGDIVVFKNGYNQIKVKITSKEIYPSFEEMLTKETLSMVLPNIKSIPEGVNVYRQYFDENIEKQYGVVALRFTRNF